MVLVTMEPLPMKLILTAIVMLAPITGKSGTPLSIQTATFCRAADSTSALLISQLKQIATGTEAPAQMMRDSLKVPAVAASQISLITQEAACKKAAERYNLEL